MPVVRELDWVVSEVIKKDDVFLIPYNKAFSHGRGAFIECVRKMTGYSYIEILKLYREEVKRL